MAMPEIINFGLMDFYLEMWCQLEVEGVIVWNLDGIFSGKGGR